MDEYSSRKFQGLGWAVNSLRARATSQRQARTAALQDKFNAVALQQQKADTTRRAGEKSVASIFGTVPMVSAPIMAKFGKQAFQGLRQRGQDLAELKAQRLGGRTEAEANYDDDLEETMGKFEDSGIKPEAEGYLEDEDVPGPSSSIGGETSAEPASGDFSTANSDLTDDFSGIEPGAGDEVEQPFSLTKGFLGPSNPTEAAQQSTEYSNTFNEGQIDMANDVANELRGLPGGSYTTNASGEFVPMEQEATGFFGRLNSRMGNTLARMGGMEQPDASSGVETVDYARASDFDTSGAEAPEPNTAFETPAEPETDISGYTTSDFGAESTDFGSAPEIPERVSSLSRFGGTADEIGTSLARQQASTGDSTLARLGQSGGSGDPPEAEIVENMRLNEPTISDIEAMPSSSEAGASSSETSGLSGAESAASRVNPDTLTGTIGEESDFGGIGAETGAETGIEAGAEAGAEVGAEVAGDAVVEGLDVAAAVAAPIPGVDIALGVIAGVATLASVGYSIYEAVHSGQQGNAPPPAQIASVPTPQPNIAGHYVGASGENIYNQPQHFQGF